MLNAVVSGIVTGALYAIAGLGLVIVYRTTRVLNFSIGGIGAVAAYVAYYLLGHRLPYAAVYVIAIAVGGVLGLIVEMGVARPLQRLSPITVALGTLGALLILQGAMGAWYGYGTSSLPVALAGLGSIHLGALGISANQILILAVTVVAALLLGLLFGRSRLGLAMRAVSSGPQTSELLGVNVSRTRLAAWCIGGAYGALAALLVTPLTYLSPSSFTTLLLTAFAAVVLGGFTSLRGVVIGAVLFSVALNVVQTYLPAGLTATYTFIGVALVLVFRPHGLFGRREHQIPEPETTSGGQQAALIAADPQPEATVGERRLSLKVRPSPKLTGWLFVLAVFLLLPELLPGPDVYLMATALATFLAVLGLNILTGYTGQVSLGQAGFLTIGAYAAATMSAHAGISPVIGLAIALVFGAVAGLIIGLPATRLSGIYLALLTLVFTFAVPEFVQWLGKFTGGANGLPLPSPTWLSGTMRQYWFALALAAVAAALALTAGATRLGRGWRAVRDSETGARALGLNPTFIKLGAFAISSALAALGGALLALLAGFVSPESFGVFQSIYLLLAVILGGSGSVFGSLLGAIFITLIPSFLPTNVSPDIIFGASMLAILLLAPDGLTGLLARLGRHARQLLPRSAVAWSGPRVTPARKSNAPLAVTSAAADPAAEILGPDDPLTAPGPIPDEPVSTDRAHGGPLLELRGVSAGYGLIRVLRDVSLHIRNGEIVAVIGANGAGKSTLLRTISQLVPRSSGVMLWHGQELGRARYGSPHKVTRMGISHVPEGRAIFPDLTVAENLTIGTFGLGTRGGDGRSRPNDREEIFEFFPRLRERQSQRAGTLSGGEQQMLAIGRALLAQPDLLLLDEPSLGLAPVIVQQVFEIVRAIAASGVAILLVEQNADAALELADRGYLISGGKIAFTGSGEQLRHDDRVVQTYLGG